MFTGIIDHCGEIVTLEKQAESLRFTIASKFINYQLGESIAVNGVCLTVTDFFAEEFSCDISPETLDKTNFRNVQVGEQLNLERPLRLQDGLGGHIVTGHVDEKLQVVNIKQQAQFLEIFFSSASENQRPLVMPKGSVAINGVSLTVNDVNAENFSVMLIPHTLTKTNLQNLNLGMSVNVEYDWLAKCVQYQTQSRRVS